MDQSKDKTEEITIPYTIQLKYPLEITEGKNIDSVTFSRRLNGRDMSPLAAGTMDQMPIGEMFYPIIAAMTGVSPEMIVKMDWQTDLSECIKVVSSFLEPSPVVTKPVGE